MAGMDERELTLPQAVEIHRLRRHRPDAEVTVHRRAWGIVIEVRESGRTVELERFDFDGTMHRDQRIDRAA